MHEFYVFSAKMILIADSGSTKTHWCLMAANGHSSEFFTDGINPFFQTEDAIRQTVSNQLLPQMAKHLWAGTITRVFFYGAGCTPAKIPVLESVLGSVFRKAQCEVYSDMTGAARALLGSDKGVACILGTGSNSCLYDGKDILWSVPALGFILGDEGSGAVLGKRLVADLLKNQLGDDLKELFLSEFDTTQADIIENVYRRPFPNRYLASLSRFCANHIDDERIQRLVEEHFRSFAKRILCQYFLTDEDRQMPLGFVGSIAYYYKESLLKVLSRMPFPVPTIVQSPMEGLKRFHAADVVPTQE